MTTEEAPAPLISWKLKLGILVLLCLQNAGHALLTRYSQNIRGERYSNTEVVIASEFLKMIASAYLTVVDRYDQDQQINPYRKLLLLIRGGGKMLLLVVSYAAANLLSYFALARVDAAVYTVLLQLKILTTAALSVLFLDRVFSGTKWRALFLLVLGCILVASPAFDKDNTNSGNNVQRKVSIFDATVGCGAILVMVTISGYSAVYFEMMLKKERVSVWERNFQLAFYSFLFLMCYLTSERNVYPTKSNMFFFEGWTVSACLLACIQAGGGLLVAATLKYADSILKTLATSGSIALSALLGYMYLDAPLDIFVSIGCVSTILAIFNYALDTTVIVANNNEGNYGNGSNGSTQQANNA